MVEKIIIFHRRIISLSRFFADVIDFSVAGGPKVAKMLSRLLTQIAPFLVDWCSCERLSLVVRIADFFKFNGSCLQKCIEEIANIARIKHLTTIAN